MLRTESFSMTVVDTAGRRVIVEGRRSEFWIGTRSAEWGATYARPRRVLIAEDGTVNSRSIPDTTMGVRVASLMMLLGVWMLKRRS